MRQRRRQSFKRHNVVIVILLCVIFAQWYYIAQVSRKKAPPAKARPPAAVFKGRIAIVLDDWGYNRNNLELLRQISSPLTLAILPRLAFSEEVANYAHALGKEVILHLPMEPHEKYRLEKDTLLTSMDAGTMQKILAKDLAGVPHARGISNHMGSRASEDSRVMRVLLAELKKRSFYFLDSFVTPKTVCQGLAISLGVPFAKRDVFLDNSDDPEYIKGQLNKLAKKASLHKLAVGIGHDRRVTLKVLKEMIPELEKKGYKFVFISDVAR